MLRNINIGIDASRCRSGGAISHLIGILSFLKPDDYGISKIYLWSFKNLLNSIPNFPWLIKVEENDLQKNLYYQLKWQGLKLKNEL